MPQTSGPAAGLPPPSCVGPDVLEAMTNLAITTPKGCFVEVGVYKGGSAWHLAKVARAQCRVLYLYDTFEGIPYRLPEDPHQVGDFKDTSAKLVQAAIPNAVIVKGIFPSSAIEMPPVAFAHLDCDQYQSYHDSLNYLRTRMAHGGVIWLDDVGCLAGADRAVQEFTARGGYELVRGKKTYIVFD